MRWGWIAVPVALLLVGHCAGPTEGAQKSLCGSLEQVGKELYLSAGEVEVAAWAEADGSVKWLLASAENDSWTILAGDGLGTRVCTVRGGHGVRVLGIRNEGVSDGK